MKNLSGMAWIEDDLAWQQLKAQQVAKGKRHITLAMTINVLFVHSHFRTVTHHTLDHGGHLGRGAPFELRINACSAFFDMPVNHNPTTTIVDMPFGQ